MSEWKTYRLGDLCSRIKSGKGIPASEVSTTGEYPVIGGNGIRGYTNTSNFNGVCAVVGRQGAYCGNVRFFSGEAYMTEHAVVIVGNELADTRYLAYLLSIMQLGHLSAQSAQPGLSVQTLSKLSINIPDISTQRRIVGILGSLDDKIELNRRINANLEAQAQALFRSWFVDFEPFRDGPFVDSQLGKIPQGWKVGTLSEIADITMGQSPKGSSYNEEGNGIIFYQGRAEFGNRFPSIRLYTTEPTRIAEINSVLLSVRAPVGDINIAKNTCCIGRGLAAIKSKHGCNSFILYLLQSLKPLLEQYNGEGTVFGCINRKEIEGLSIIIPKESVINEFEEIVEKIDSEIKNLTIEQENLSALRDTLLPKLMAGEIAIE